jgi:hypothetical protein
MTRPQLRFKITSGVLEHVHGGGLPHAGKRLAQSFLRQRKLPNVCGALQSDVYGLL